MTALGVHEDFDPLQPEELELWCRAAKKSSLEEEKSSQPSNDEVTVKFFNDGRHCCAVSTCVVTDRLILGVGSYQVLSFSRGVSLFLLKDKIAQQCGIELDRLEISSMPTPKSETKSVITDQVELNKLFDECKCNRMIVQFSTQDNLSTYFNTLQSNQGETRQSHLQLLKPTMRKHPNLLMLWRRSTCRFQDNNSWSIK